MKALNYYSKQLANKKLRVSDLFLTTLPFQYSSSSSTPPNNMAESFLFGIAQNVLGKLASLALAEVVLAWGVKSEFPRLQNTLSSIQAVLLDAEEQQANNHQLKDWLEKLKDVIYEIDEVLDDFEIKVLQQKVRQGSTIRKVRYFFSRSNPVAFSFKMGHKIKGIRERLDQINVDKNQFTLSYQPVDRRIIHSERETHSFLDASSVIGRDEDKEKIVQLLMPSFDHETLCVIPIVGIGGLGKTTLAKMVFNDDKVVENFGLRIWVCVSEESDVGKLIEKIIIAAKPGTDCKNLGLEQLQRLLRDTLNSKKYLLILDDVWNLDRKKWEELRALVSCSSGGSKIIVTTRNHTIASFMGSIGSHILEGLPHDDCLSLFKKWAFKEGQETQSQSNLMKIGEEIVRKCKGVPLAVSTLGGMLFMKSEEREWERVRDNKIWELEQNEGDILPALRLSYDQLPHHLKRCFAYCSMYPKDAKISNFELISFWLAHDLIHSSDQREELEDVGKRYIHELCALSFFQDIEDWEFFLVFKMHDLVHDLALSITKLEYTTTDSNTNHDEESNRKNNIPVSRNVRHVAFSNYVSDSSSSNVPSFLLELNNLRSIHFQFEGEGPTNRSFVETCVSRFKRLRLLDLSNSSFETLPNSICRLKHLRFLSLRDNNCIKSLPDSICKLVCLQTLLIGDCRKLEKLPRDLGKLPSLRFLWVTTQESCLLGKGRFTSNNCMTSLRTLVIGDCHNLESLFGDDHADDKNNRIRCLTNLRTLAIGNCDRLATLPRGMRYLSALETLYIVDCENLDLIEDAQVGEDDVVQTGSGLRSLRSLVIEDIPKLLSFPRWLLQGPACNTLKHIGIKDCKNFTTIPDWMIEDLNSLQKLEIKNCPQLTSLPNGMERLTTLTEIHIEDCEELSSRCQRDTGGLAQDISCPKHLSFISTK